MSDELKPQSIDTPEFADLMQKWALSPSCDLVQKRYDAIILSADSRQIYRGFDVGTAKPATHDRSRVPHRGIDVADRPAVVVESAADDFGFPANELEQV